MEQKQGAREMQIRASNDDLKGVYSNTMRVTHTKEEFVLDFFNIFSPSGVLSARVIVSPGHLKRMIGALEENMGNYEKKFGPVPEAEGKEEKEIGFK